MFTSTPINKKAGLRPAFSTAENSVLTCVSNFYPVGAKGSNRVVVET